MSTESQSATLEYLSDPQRHGLSRDEIVTVQTHISVVVLAGDRAYKLKRAVRLPYVDFSTPERRLKACQNELTLNRRTAPNLYLSVRRITRDRDGHLSFDGSGEMVDAVVEMQRFADHALLETMVERGDLSTPLVARLAGVIAGFHKNARIIQGSDVPSALTRVISDSEQILSGLSFLPKEKTQPLCAMLYEELGKRSRLLMERAAAGKVRHCHGDLHLRNICVIDDEPTLFDCVEFDDSLAKIDVLYDLAFLLMDLWSRGLEAHANLVMNRYLDGGDEEAGLPLMPLFMALRATIRAHVVGTEAAECSGGEKAIKQAAAMRYLDLGLACLSPCPARLVAIGGLSGSGKSTLAATLAPRIGSPPGARVLSSDRIRKRMLGVSAEVPLDEKAYQAEMSERVYAEQAIRAARITGAGCVVIADAVFDREPDRKRIEGCAARTRASFDGYWLDVLPGMLLARVKARQNDASDANEAVVHAQLARQRSVEDWTHIDAGGPIEAAAAEALQLLEARRSSEGD